MSNTDSDTELLPCPFCGHEPRSVHDPDAPDATDQWLIWCVNADCDCGPDGSFAVPKAKAIAAWNTRASLNTRTLPTGDAVERLIDEGAVSRLQRVQSGKSIVAAYRPLHGLQASCWEAFRRDLAIAIAALSTPTPAGAVELLREARDTIKVAHRYASLFNRLTDDAWRVAENKIDATITRIDTFLSEQKP